MSDLGAEVLSNGSAHVMNESHQAFLKTDKKKTSLDRSSLELLQETFFYKALLIACSCT